MAAKFFTGLPLDGPDPECVGGDGEEALAALSSVPVMIKPRPAQDHSKPSTTRAHGHLAATR